MASLIKKKDQLLLFKWKEKKITGNASVKQIFMIVLGYELLI